MVSILLGVWNGGGVCCCCPAQCSGVARPPTHPAAVLASTAVVSRTVPLPGVWCVGGECVWVVSVWWVSSVRSPPRRGGGWGHHGWGGSMAGGGWHGE